MESSMSFSVDDANIIYVSYEATPVILSPARPASLALESQSGNVQKLLYESPRRRRVDEAMRVSFLSMLPEEELERYPGEFERKTGIVLSRLSWKRLGL